MWKRVSLARHVRARRRTESVRSELLFSSNVADAPAVATTGRISYRVAISRRSAG